jgi:hypothetical protein
MRLVPEFATVVMFYVTGGVNARCTSRSGKGEQMKRISVFLTLPLLVALVLLSGYALAAPAAQDVGYRDFSYDAASVVAPTGQKPQSKLWFNDGTWWGSLFNRSAEEHHIYRYDRATHTWSDTGTVIDERNSSKADVLWDGSHLYVATAGPTSASSHSGRILRYSYDAATKKYSVEPGFPVTVTSGGMEAIVLDKDTTGRLWVSYTQNNQVYVNRSLGDDQSWGTPFVLPVTGTTVSADDISGVVAFDSQIGVMWSNQVDDAMYFATHTDGDPDNVWQGSRTAIQGPKTADDHISLRSLQADDVSGKVFAAVKTSLGDLNNPDTNAPLILLLVRDQAGNWTNYRFGRVIDHHTRPIVMIDQEHRNLYMFATAPETSGTIYYKKTPLSNISFSEGLGTPFIQSTTDTHINNATSTKQNVNSATGPPVLASDDTSKYYWHNIMDLGDTGTVDTTAPQITITTPPQGATYSLNQSVAASYECTDADSGVASCKGTATNGANIDTSSTGTKTFIVVATDKAGNTNSVSHTYTVNDPTTPGGDTTAPTVVSTVPGSGAKGVSPSINNVKATFSEAMDASTTDGDPSTITATTFMLFTNGSTTQVAAKVSYDSSTRTAKLNPNNNLRRGVTYRAVLTTGVQDVAGNPLAQQIEWLFTVKR